MRTIGDFDDLDGQELSNSELLNIEIDTGRKLLLTLLRRSGEDSLVELDLYFYKPEIIEMNVRALPSPSAVTRVIVQKKDGLVDFQLVFENGCIRLTAENFSYAIVDEIERG